MGILVTGGAGYIGSAVVEDLVKRGEQVAVLDNLVYGHREAVPDGVPFYEGSIGDKELVRRIVAENNVDSCMHFSAYAYVGESVEQPSKYFDNNFSETLALLDALLGKGVKNFIFSSTCATYGVPTRRQSRRWAVSGSPRFTRHKGAPVSCNRTCDRCGAVPGSQAVR